MKLTLLNKRPMERSKEKADHSGNRTFEKISKRDMGLETFDSTIPLTAFYANSSSFICLFHVSQIVLHLFNLILHISLENAPLLICNMWGNETYL